MGWFSGSTQITTNSSSVLLIEDTPDLINDSVFNSIVNDRPITEDIRAAIVNSIATNSSLYYTYGRDQYFYGLPEGTQVPPQVHWSVIKGVLDSVHGGPTLVSFSTLELCEASWIAEKHIADNYGYDRETMVVENPPPPPQTPDGDVLFDAAFISDVDRVTIQYSYEFIGNPRTYQEVIVADAKGDELYYHCTYYGLDQFLQVNTRLLYFNYRASSGEYPTLDLPPEFSTVSEYYPIIPVCLKGVNLADRDLFGPDSDASEDEKERFRTSENLARYLGVNYEDLGLGLFGSGDEDDPNPNDPANLDYGYLILGLHVGSDKLESIKYLYDYWDYLSGISTYTEADYNASVGLLTPQEAYNTGNYERNQIVVAEQNYKMVLSYTYIKKELVNRVIIDPDDDSQTVGPLIGYTIREVESGRAGSYIRFVRQVTDTQCFEITMFEPLSSVTIEGGHTIESDAGDISDDSDDNWIIPLNRQVADLRGILELNTLLYDCIRLIINSITETEVKWYQTGIFKLVIAVVSVAVTIYTGGFAAGSITAMIQAAGVAAIRTLALSTIINLTAKLVVDVLGIENKYLTMIISIATAVIVGRAIGSINLPSSELVQADTLLTTVNRVQMGLNYGVQRVAEDLQAEYEREVDYINEEQEKIKDLMDAMKPHNHVIQALQVGSSYFTMEDVSGYYARTLNQNPGILVLSEIEDNVGRALDLPGINNLNSLET